MIKKSFLILLMACLLTSIAAQTADTITVKAHENVIIKTDPSVGHTRYPVWAKFPSVETEYYKVIAYLTFECATGENCGEWDYINYIHIGKIGGVHGDSLGWEVGRYITPYGNSWHSSRNWKHGWYYDMTDFRTLFHDSVQIIYTHTGYETNVGRGWKINLTFYMIQGTPALSVHNITPLWKGSFKYGDESDPITDHLITKNITLRENTKTANLKILQTGHGMDTPDNCAEFCEKLRTIKVDGNIIDERYIWRECGFNSLFPQAGTWLYDRANWCPGEDVPYHNLYLHDLTGGEEHRFDLMMEPYVATENIGNWVFSTYLFEYGAPNYTIDVAIEDIIAPSDKYPHNRVNPICGVPTIVVKNNGSEILTSMIIEYGPKGGVMNTFNWTGNLNLLQYDTIRLYSIPEWDSGDGSNIFEVRISNPNGKEDEFPNSNTAYSSYSLPPEHSSDLIINLRTNKAPSENYYYLINLNTMEVVLEKNDLEVRTNYKDTVYLQKGCYSLELYDDGLPPDEYPLNKDGLSWWANTYDGSGSFSLYDIKNKTMKSFGTDFGTKILYQFVVTESTLIKEYQKPTFLLEISPNPSTGIIDVHYDFGALSSGKRKVIVKDIFGRNISFIFLPEITGRKQLNLSAIPKGIYLIILSCDSGFVSQKLILY